MRTTSKPDATAPARVSARERRDLGRTRRASRFDPDAAHRRLGLLSEISQFLLGSLDYMSALNGLTRMVLPELGDGAFVHIADGEHARSVAITHLSPVKATRLQQLDRLGGLALLVREPLGRALRTGRPERGSRGEGEATADVAERAALAEIEPRRFMVIPLATRGRVLGALVLLVTESNRRYSDDDLEFAQHVARRTATAVDNLRLYEEAQQARVAAEEANRLKDDFLTTLSHELRTPLNAILGWARMLRSGRLDQAFREKALVTIERNALAQAQIVEDLLDVSRVITGSLRLNVQPLNVPSLVESAVNTVRPAAEAKGLRLECHWEPIDAIVGDPGRLQQVVWNLVSNATKFTPAGGRIAVRVWQAGGQVHVSVTDDGDGISPEFLPHVFERFRQADGTSTRSHGGLGLGLAIVRHLVEAHGGTVEAESAGVGQGSTFTVHLPARQATLQPSAAAAGPEAEAWRNLLGVTVLVVDDQQDARDLVSAILRHHGAIVRTAESADEAMAALDTFTPLVLVADIAMPGEDGYALLARVRRLYPTLPAIALTAFARPDDRRRALDAGFELHMPKPIDPRELVEAVADLGERFMH